MDQGALRLARRVSTRVLICPPASLHSSARYVKPSKAIPSWADTAGVQDAMNKFKEDGSSLSLAEKTENIGARWKARWCSPSAPRTFD